MWEYTRPDELYHNQYQKGLHWKWKKKKSKKYTTNGVSANDYADAYNIHPFMVSANNSNGRPRARKVIKNKKKSDLITGRRYRGMFDSFHFGNQWYMMRPAMNKRMRAHQIHSMYKVADSGKKIANQFLNMPVRKRKK